MNKIDEQLQKFYHSLESLNTMNIWTFHRKLANVGKIDNSWEDKLISERKFLFYIINKGELKSNAQFTNANGKIVEASLSENDVDYLKIRLKETSNIFLKARYAHLLWQETKHCSYADQAIDNYKFSISKIKPKEINQLPILLSAVLYISKKSKIKKTEVKQYTLDLLGEMQPWIKSDILDAVLDNNIFSNSDLKKIAIDLPNWIDFSNSGSYFSNKNKLLKGITIYNKVGMSDKFLYEMLAKNEDFILEQHPDDADFIKYSTIGLKAKFLKTAGKNEEADEVFQEYNRLKQKVRLNKYSTQLSDEAHELFNAYLKIMAEAILEMPTDQILGYFAMAEEILVDPTENKERTKESINNSLFHLFSTSVFDINSNIKSIKDAESLNNEYLKNYTIGHAVQCWSLFLKVFVDGIIIGKMNYYKVHDFLEQHTWYGIKFQRSMTYDETKPSTNWISMLAPGIHNLFSQFELSVLMRTNKIDNFILAIDSLTTKFEGALRDFIRLSNGNTTTIKKGEFVEQLLEELIENPKIQELFTVRDIELFRYTFTKNGKNLRNNVAHSFMQFSDYDLQTAGLIFLCFLRLGKYNFEKKT